MSGYWCYLRNSLPPPPSYTSGFPLLYLSPPHARLGLRPRDGDRPTESAESELRGQTHLRRTPGTDVRRAASRARSLLAYRGDMSRRSLRGSWRSGLLVTIYSQPPSAGLRPHPKLKRRRFPVYVGGANQPALRGGRHDTIHSALPTVCHRRPVRHPPNQPQTPHRYPSRSRIICARREEIEK